MSQVPLYPCWVGGIERETSETIEVLDKYRRCPIGLACRANEAIFQEAITIAQEGQKEMSCLSSLERQQILEEILEGVQKKKDRLAKILSMETGKPIKDSRTEVERMVHTLKISAEEAVRFGSGEVLPLDRAKNALHHRGFWKRVALGPCGLITPFNFPLNLAAHKFGPALAMGSAFILKPSPETPLTSLMMGEIFSQTSLPPKAFSILPAYPEDCEPLILDPKIPVISFTGSQVGWKLKGMAPQKKFLLELGGNAACLISSSAKDLDSIAQRLILGAFYQSGQVCISVQRIYIHESLYEDLKDRLVQKVLELKRGDPLEEDTFIGPMISEKAAQRVESWIQDALDKGAHLLCGGKRDGVMMEPTLLEKVPSDHPLCQEEVFGPVAILERVQDFMEGVAKINASPYGLQAGVFTESLEEALKSWDLLEVGGVIINDIPAWRVDHMPYGGVKKSGFGREGVRWAMEEMSEIRLLVLRQENS